MSFKVKALLVLAVLALPTFYFGMWYVERKVNYILSYRGLVSETVRDLVKTECLK